jgi:hypothetical protein
MWPSRNMSIQKRRAGKRTADESTPDYPYCSIYVPSMAGHSVPRQSTRTPQGRADASKVASILFDDAMLRAGLHKDPITARIVPRPTN